MEKFENLKETISETVDDNRDMIALLGGTIIGTVALIPLCIWGYKEIGKLQAKGFVSEVRKSGLLG